MIAAFVIIAVYIIGTLLISVYGHRAAQDTPQDYFLAGRTVGAVAMFFTLIATNFSAFFFLGFAGAGYRIGYSYYAMMSFSTAIVAFAFYFIGHKTWKISSKNNFITPPEMMGELLGSKLLRFVFLSVMIIFTLPYIAIQPIGAGKILHVISGGQIPYFLGAVLLTFFIVFYVFWGGMRSVAWTDVFQGIVMFACIITAMLVIANHFGGIGEANRKAYNLDPQLFSRAGKNGYFTPKIWFSFSLLFILSVPMFPQMFMRFFICRSPKSLKTSATLYPIVTAILFICPVAIGVWGHIDFPGLDKAGSDNILPQMLNAEYFPSWLSTAILLGAVAAFMSTLDSQLLALSSMITRDIYLVFFKPEASLKEQVFLGKLLVVILAIVGLAIAYHPPGTIFYIVREAFTGLSILFPTVFCAFYWKRTTARACILSIIATESLFICYLVGIIPKSWCGGFLPVVPLTAVAFALIVAVSLYPEDKNV
ncbi:sodium:solute symporter family protein [Candidatus Uabimicrobium sp. HlEnr_7]|uniref:sodium:solute symporter family transporter n=1 Tax=Candidatus Uabimicrobium helgolandensis TaxID=3095367 RepID=UPI0035560E90